MKEFRICESCDHHNEVSFLECVECGADLSFVHPTTLADESKEAPVSTSVTAEPAPQSQITMRMSQLQLISVKDSYVITVPWEGGVIGREGSLAPEYFADNLFVSNEHAVLTVGSSGYLLVDQRSTNGTKLNGVKLEKGTEYSVRNGDRIVFANLEFRVQQLCAEQREKGIKEVYHGSQRDTPIVNADGCLYRF